MLRALTSSVLSTLLILTLLWGGCISCPRFFMFPSSAKNCCKAGKCERQGQSTQSPRECKRMPLEQPGPNHVQIELATVTVSSGAVLAPTLILACTRLPLEPLVTEHSPPDWQALLSTFLV